MNQLIVLALLIGGGAYAYGQFNETDSQFHQAVMNVWNEIDAELSKSGGTYSVADDGPDYESAGRPNLIGYAARQHGNGGEYQRPQPLWGETTDLTTVYEAYRSTYSAYLQAEEWYGPTARETRAALDRYYQAKYQYDALNARGR